MEAASVLTISEALFAIGAISSAISFPLTIGGLYHIIQQKLLCHCNICTEFRGKQELSKLGVPTSILYKIILSCPNFDAQDPVEFIIWELQSSRLSGLNSISQFFRRVQFIGLHIYRCQYAYLTDLFRNDSDSESHLCLHNIFGNNLLFDVIVSYIGSDFFITLSNSPKKRCVKESVSPATEFMSSQGGCITEVDSIVYNISHLRTTDISETVSMDVQSSNSMLTNNQTCHISIIDVFGKELKVLSSSFRSSDNTFFLFPNQSQPSVFTAIRDKLFRWALLNNSEMLAVDTPFQDFDMAVVPLNTNCTKSWYNGCVYVVSENFITITYENNSDSNDERRSFGNLEEFCQLKVSQYSTQGIVDERFEILIKPSQISAEFHKEHKKHTGLDNSCTSDALDMSIISEEMGAMRLESVPETRESSVADSHRLSSVNSRDMPLLDSCDFHTIHRKWLNRDSSKEQSSDAPCFALLYRQKRTLFFINPQSKSVVRTLFIKFPTQYKLSFASEVKTIFYSESGEQRLLAYIIPQGDTHPFGFRESDLCLVKAAVDGSILLSKNLPFGDWIGDVCVSTDFVYIDVWAGQFSELQYWGDHMPSHSPSQEEITSEDMNSMPSKSDSLTIESGSVGIYGSAPPIGNSKNRWESALGRRNSTNAKCFSCNGWRYCLDLKTFNIVGLFSLPHKRSYSRLCHSLAKPHVFNY